MLISDRYRYVYIGIPRTGSLSIRRALAAPEDRDIDDDKLYLPPGHKQTINHATARQIRELNPGIWDRYFKFAVVRNPWERVLSWYAGLAPHKKDVFEKWLLEDFYGRTAKTISVLKRYKEDKFEKIASEENLRDYRLDYLLPCADWVADEGGQVMTDFIARFENLAKDWQAICAHIGLGRLKLPHANRSHHGHYSAYYTDEMKEFVARQFKKDLDMFGYVFERLEEPYKAALK